MLDLSRRTASDRIPFDSRPRAAVLDLLLSAQQVEESYQFQDLPDPRARVGDSQRAVDGSRHVERPDQLTHARGVDSRHLCQIHDDRALPAPKSARTSRRSARLTGTRRGPSTRTMIGLLEHSFKTVMAPSSPGRTCAPGQTVTVGSGDSSLQGLATPSSLLIPKGKTIEDTEM